jgi:hypothetical protein
MQVALLIVAAIALLGLLLGSLLRRVGSPLGFWISFSAQTLLRLTVGVFFAATAVVAAQEGGFWFIVLAVVMAALAASMFALTGIHIWVARKYGVQRDE